MLRDPVRLLVAVGVKVILIVELAPAARLPAGVRLAEIAAGGNSRQIDVASPVLVRVTDCAALVVFTSCAANVSAETERLATGAIPVPVNAVVGAAPAALLLTLRVPLRLLRAIGVKLTLMVQLLPAGRLTPQLFV